MQRTSWTGPACSCLSQSSLVFACWSGSLPNAPLSPASWRKSQLRADRTSCPAPRRREPNGQGAIWGSFGRPCETKGEQTKKERYSTSPEYDSWYFICKADMTLHDDLAPLHDGQSTDVGHFPLGRQKHPDWSVGQFFGENLTRWSPAHPKLTRGK